MEYIAKHVQTSPYIIYLYKLATIIFETELATIIIYIYTKYTSSLCISYVLMVCWCIAAALFIQASYYYFWNGASYYYNLYIYQVH
jgi:hypothetical protein